MKYKDFRDAPKDTKIWGCAFSVGFDKNDTQINGLHVSLFQEPTLGVIKNGNFRKIKKNGEVAKQSVSIWSRKYADTYEESVEIFNGLVDKEIKDLEISLNYVKGFKIE